MKNLLVITLLFLGSSLAFADATLQVGPVAPPLGSDPNLFTGNVVTVYQNQGGAANLNSVWLLIVGVPNTASSNPFGAGITNISASAGGATSSAYLGYKASMGPGQEAYSLLGLPGANNSNSFVNWAAADLAHAGITANSFGLYEFAITSQLAGKDYVSFTFDELPSGSIVIAYGQVLKASALVKGRQPNTSRTLIYDTPFTQAGLEVPPPARVPEPGTVLMLGSGMCGVLGVLRRKLAA